MASGGSADGAVVFRLGAGADPGSIAVYRDDAVIDQGPSPGGASAFLLEKLQEQLVKNGTSGIWLHAAALVRGGPSLLLAGQTGSGKTTLATRLVLRGFDHLTDELVWIDPGGTRRLDLCPLSKAQAAARIMRCLVDARGRTMHGFDDVAHLVHEVSAYSLRYSDLDEAGRALESLLAP